MLRYLELMEHLQTRHPMLPLRNSKPMPRPRLVALLDLLLPPNRHRVDWGCLVTKSKQQHQHKTAKTGTLRSTPNLLKPLVLLLRPNPLQMDLEYLANKSQRRFLLRTTKTGRITIGQRIHPWKLTVVIWEVVMLSHCSNVMTWIVTKILGCFVFKQFLL